MIRRFQIANQLGDTVTVINLGARLTSWVTEVNNTPREIIVSYDDDELYNQDQSYVGAIAGPFANRIKDAQFSIKNHAYHLSANEGANILHSGPNALDTCMWQVKEHSNRAITLSYWLEDGFNGFPGAMSIEVEYRLAENDSQLKINFNIRCEKPTYVNPTSHAYFNLSAVQNTVNQHKLLVNANHYTDVDQQNVPTGKLLSTANSQFDFSEFTLVDDKKVDHNFVIQNSATFQAKLQSPEQDLTLEVISGYPGAQVYTGDYLNKPLRPRQGMCIEPQFFPNSPNIKEFTIPVIGPDNPFNEKIIYRLHK